MEMNDHSSVGGSSGCCSVVCNRSAGAEAYDGNPIGVQAVFEKVLSHGPGSHDRQFAVG